MDRNSRKAALANEAGASPPSDAWLFAQALLGKPAPSPSRAEADAQQKREQLEWLAKISPKHESHLRTLLSARSEATREREELEWLAKVSTEHDSRLRSLLRAEAEAREAQQRSRRLLESSTVLEQDWDSAKHPRLGGAPNAGWFASTGGAGGSGGRLDRPGTASEPNGAGHHGVTAAMLELAHAWWQTNSLLQQSRRDIEELPKRIAKEQSQLGSGGRYAYIHAQNLAKAKQDLAAAKALVPQLEGQLRALEQKYRDSGYDEVPYSTWTPGETLVGGRGIEQVGQAVTLAGLPAGLKPTGIEFDVALAAGSVLQLGKLALGKALSKAPRSIFKPSVTDPKLQNITQDLYKGAKTPNPIGSGSTADAIRNELKAGQATYGRFHSQKGQEYARALEKWLQKNSNASAADRAAAQQMLNDLRSALKGN